MKSLIYALLVCSFICLVACETTTSTFKNNGSFTYNEVSSSLNKARLHRYVDSVSDGIHLQLALCSPNMTMTNGVLGGYGSLLMMTIQTDSTALSSGTYTVSDADVAETVHSSESYLLTISEDKKDTVIQYITSGSLDVSTTEQGQKYLFNFNINGPLNGFYEGTYTYFNDVDGEQVGTLFLGDLEVPLQRGDLMLWGSIFEPDLNYFEYYFYSTDLRYTDAGAISKGFMFVIGLQSAGEQAPIDGLYPVSRKNENQTALYGHKSGSINWGTYWINYITASATERAFVLKDSIFVSSSNAVYAFEFHCTDQLSNKITGSYNSDFNVIDIR